MAGVVVLDGKIGKLPYPLYARFRNPYSKGVRFHIPPEAGTQQYAIQLPDMNFELVEVTFSSSGYKDMDSWSLLINDQIIYDHIYTKEVGQVKKLKMVKRITPQDQLNLLFHNDSMTSKVVWFDLEFAAEKPVINTPQ